MTCVVLKCGVSPDSGAARGLDAALAGLAATVLELSAVPTRKELKQLDAFAKEILPEDPTPSLDEIAAQPDVRHLGAPEIAPQKPHLKEALRVVVIGSDAALSAVLTRMMRGDYLWAEVGYAPVDAASTAARNWGLPSDVESALSVALNASVMPVPLIRNDAGLAVAGSATISEWENTEITGEIIVDDHVLVRHGAPVDQMSGNASKKSGNARSRSGQAGPGTYGARLVPMVDAPGIVAAKAISPVVESAAIGLEENTQGGHGGFLRGGFFARWRTPVAPGQLDVQSVCTGRAVQAGGPSLRVIVDGVSAKRPVKRVTFYRHLRDLQIARAS
ncbi:hypothetical protein [Corynebacterium sp.]|uniref:hypothetical protein n=1 Tax=Corynebacterium sp. TaxID=1720 RepID=UPI0026DCB648|nr:hypothetical protein [Corynebacterium sp.]MDO5032735.1 hypothetical protein [Corynebacterium sp.]